MKKISLFMILAVMFVYASNPTYSECTKAHEKNPLVVWKNGKCVIQQTDQQKKKEQEIRKNQSAEVGILMNGSGACIKDCGSYTIKAAWNVSTRYASGIYKPLNSKSMACVYNQIEKARIEQKRRSRHCIRNGNIKDSNQREKVYNACINAELLYSEYYSLIGSDRTCIYK